MICVKELSSFCTVVSHVKPPMCSSCCVPGAVLGTGCVQCRSVYAGFLLTHILADFIFNNLATVSEKVDHINKV